MNRYGVIGKPLIHSFSKAYFENKFRKEKIESCSFHAYELEAISDFPQFVENESPVGVTVTIPYKQSIIPYLDELDEEVQKVGAVNVVKCIYAEHTQQKKPFMKGYNTDIYGFEISLKPLLQPKHKKALVLGTGGASLAVAYVLEKLGINFLYVSREPKNNQTIAYSDLSFSHITSHLLLINTTPVGMYPHISETPFVLSEYLTSDHICYDLVYNPERTLFLQQAEKRGAIIKNGIEMLHRQADKAWEIWNS